jgi:cardiolipin synthase (CMP-forming)
MIIKKIYEEYLVARHDFKDTPVKHIPNFLSFVRIILGPIIIFYYINGFYILTFSLALLASLTDFLDGILARKLKAYSKFGQTMDTIADKWLSSILVIINIVNYPIFIITLILEGFIAKINIKAYVSKKEARTNKIGKIKTLSLYFALLVGILSLTFHQLVYLKYFTIFLTTILQVKALIEYEIQYLKTH